MNNPKELTKIFPTEDLVEMGKSILVHIGEEQDDDEIYLDSDDESNDEMIGDGVGKHRKQKIIKTEDDLGVVANEEDQDSEDFDPDAAITNQMIDDDYMDFDKLILDLV